MNKKLWYMLVPAALVVGVLFGWLLFGGAGDNGMSGPSATETVEVWTCSMHPQIRKSGPGQCPICGMNLVKLGDANFYTNEIALSADAVRLAGITTAQAAAGATTSALSLNGKVMPDERRVYVQAAHIAGRIETLKLNFEGEEVRKGEALATIYSPELVTARDELLTALARKDSDPDLYAAARAKLHNWKLSDREIARIEEGDDVDAFPITADYNGFVTEKLVTEGDYVDRGEALYKVADLSRAWVVFDAYEQDLPWISNGKAVSFTVSSLPGETFKGSVSYVDPVLDPVKRVAAVRVDFANPGYRLKPGMFAKGSVARSVRNDDHKLVIPRSAVLWTGTRSIVYVQKPDSSGVHAYELREVTLGASTGDGYVINKGLEPGESYVVNGVFAIDAAAQLAGKPSMMNH